MRMSATVKQGETRITYWRVNVDLSGAVVSHLRARNRKLGGSVRLLPVVVRDAPGGVVVHQLDGTLPVGEYEITLPFEIGGLEYVAPSKGFGRLVVEPGLG